MRVRPAAVVAVVVLAGGAAIPAAASTRSTAASRTLVLELASSGDGAAATTVPSSAIATRGNRAHVAAGLLAGAGTKEQALADARAAGLTVTATSAWTVTASGASSLVDALVGSDVNAATVPTAWSGVVAHVLDTRAGGGEWKAAAAQSVSALSQAYGGGTPSNATPALTGATPVIATIQLSGWDNSVLTDDAKNVYADQSYDPVASGQYTAVPVGRAEATAVNDGDGADEVALDQEALLAAAPELRQRAYFAPNSATGYVSGLQAIYDDVVAGVPIVAVSTSWGACETGDRSSTRSTMDAVLAKLTAVGVTVLAASGDDGAFDCTDSGGNATIGVDFPASDPHVVAVGATTHSNGSGAPAPDTVWSQDSATSGEAGSGGGVSVAFARPSYQSGLAVSGRAVPDIAVDGDPSTGIPVVTSGSVGVHYTTVTGGTSLSAPLATALLADAAAARTAATGVTSGYGDIHAVLYAHPEAFFDVTSYTTDYGEGNYGYTQTPGAGYDEASGLGTPRFDVLAGVLNATASAASTAAPAPVAPSVKVTGFSRPDARTTSATVTWSTSGGNVPVQGFLVTVTDGTRSVLSRSLSAASRSLSVTLPAGSTDSVAVTLLSTAGTTRSTATLTVPVDDRSATAKRGWTAVRDKGAFLGTLSSSASAGRTAVLKTSGTTFRVTFRDSNVGGLARIYVDGKLLATVDTFSTATRENVTTLVRAGKGRHTLTVLVLGRHSSRSRGSNVSLDALSAS